MLITDTVDGVPFTLDKLGAPIKKWFPTNKEGYSYYWPDVCVQYSGQKLPDAPYWVLMMQNILKDSRDMNYETDKNYETCKNAVKPYSKEGYRLPHVLEAATMVLTHFVKNNQEYLLGNDLLTYTYCLEKCENDPVIVRDFSTRGLNVEATRYNCNGVCCCWKL